MSGRGINVQKLKQYDIFITHAWRNHEDWIRMGELLDGLTGITWRNFSVPWHDPAMTPNSVIGQNYIINNLQNQIIPVHGVILLTGVYAVKSSQKWLDTELQFARKHNKPVVGVPAYGKSSIPDEMSILCDQTVPWNASEIIGAIDTLMERV